jgi:hypothetical protein
MLFFRAVIRRRRARLSTTAAAVAPGRHSCGPSNASRGKRARSQRASGDARPPGFARNRRFRLPAPRVAAFLTVADVCVHS